jgi:hypothetical protein
MTVKELAASVISSVGMTWWVGLVYTINNQQKMTSDCSQSNGTVSIKTEAVNINNLL